MLVSTRGRYALRFVIDLAENGGFESGDFIALKDVSARQDISLKYLENIASCLVKSGLLVGKNGKNGGYKLTKDPSVCTVYDILSATEGKISPVACLKSDTNTCKRKNCCKTLPVWQKLDETIGNFLSGITVASLLDRK